MAAFSSVAGFVIAVGFNPGASQELSEAFAPSGESTLGVDAGAAARTEGLSGASGEAFTSAGVEVGGATIFEAVHTIPTKKDLGPIASEQTFSIEIWSAYRDIPMQIGRSSGDGVEVSGTGGTTLSGPSIPAKLGPLCSKIFTATVPGEGSANVANVAEFELYFDAFGGPGFGAVTVPITGMRIVLFPFDPNWKWGVRERIEYKTTTITARTGAEQRCRLRLRPRRSIAFDALLFNSEGQTFDAVLWDRQSQIFGVPWWPELVRYSGTLVPGATTIAVDTNNRMFSLAQMVMVWSSPTACEVQSVESVSSGLITCAPLSGSYANPMIVPVFPGRMDPSQGVDRVTSKISSASIRFWCEVGVNDPRPSPAPMTRVYGYDVLEVEPDWKQPKGDARRILSRLDNGFGPIFVRDRGGVSFQAQDFDWYLSGRAQIQAFRDFVDCRGGALVPFWVPTWRQDLTVAEQAPGSSSGLLINACGYTSRMFPDTARRYIAIRNPAGGWIYRKITSASTAGATETLGLDSTLGVTIPAGAPISFLTLCRLDDDTAEINWSTVSLAQAKTRFFELPKEIPA